MKKIIYAISLATLFFAFGCAAQTSGKKTVINFEQYKSYFENNNSGLKGDVSYLNFDSQKDFDKIFGTAAAMGENSFLPPDVFNTKIVVVAIKRGSLRKYDDVQITSENGKLFVSYKTEDSPPGSATFSSPLIVSVNKGKYKKVVFTENGKIIKTIKIRKYKKIF